MTRASGLCHSLPSAVRRRLPQVVTTIPQTTEPNYYDAIVHTVASLWLMGTHQRFQRQPRKRGGRTKQAEYAGNIVDDHCTYCT